MRKPSAATVIATLALFVALGGTGYAAGLLPVDSVGSAQLIDGSVRAADIRNGAVHTEEIADGAVGSAEIRNGSIQLGDLSRAAVRGLEGPAGPPGPAGPAGADGSGGGGVTIRDANGDPISGVLALPAPDVNVNTGVVNGFYRMMDGVVWHVTSTGQIEAPNAANADSVYYLTDDCTGPAYVDEYVPDVWGDPRFAVGNSFTLRVDSTNWVVTSTTALHTRGEPLSGFRRADASPHDVYCENGNLDYLGPDRRTGNARMVTPGPPSPAPIDAPMTYDQ